MLIGRQEWHPASKIPAAVISGGFNWVPDLTLQSYRKVGRSDLFHQRLKQEKKHNRLSVFYIH